MKKYRCPDCENYVFDNSVACPKCGCPAEYLEEINEVKQVDGIKFKLLGYEISYPYGTEEFAQLFGFYISNAYEVYDTFCSAYKNCRSIDKALELIPSKANLVLDTMIEGSVKSLYEAGIIISPIDFMQKYGVGYGYYYAPLLDDTVAQYAQIMGEQEELRAYRETIKASRGRWVGGGFGIKGAIKGAMKAGVMNATSDFMHSFGDSRRSRQDNDYINSQLKTLYRNSEDVMCRNILGAFRRIFEATIQEFKCHGFFTNEISFDVQKARELYNATLKYEEDSEKKIKNYIQCITYYPGNTLYYKPIINLLMSDSMDEFQEFVDFWNIWYLFPELTQKIEEENRTAQKIEEDRTKYNEFLNINNIEDFSLDDYSVENATKIRKIVNNYLDTNGFIKREEIPDDILSYMEDFFRKNNSNEFSLIPLDCSLLEFCKSIHDDAQIFRTVASDMWIYGQPKRKKTGAMDIINQLSSDDGFEELPFGFGPTQKNIEVMEANNDQILFFFDYTEFQSGKKGFAITRRYIYNLKDYSRIPLNEIRSFKFEEVDSFLTDIKDRMTIIGKNNSMTFTKEDFMCYWTYVEQLVRECMKRFYSSDYGYLLDESNFSVNNIQKNNNSENIRTDQSHEILKLVKNWNVDYIREKKEDDLILGERFDKEILERFPSEEVINALEPIDYYGETRKFCINFYLKYNTLYIPASSACGAQLKKMYAYDPYNNDGAMLTWPAVMEWIPTDYSIEAFFGCLKIEKMESLKDTLLKDIWILGDPLDEIIYLRDYQVDIDKVLMCIAHPKNNNLSKRSGVFFTDTSIVEFKSEEIISSIKYSEIELIKKRISPDTGKEECYIVYSQDESKSVVIYRLDSWSEPHFRYISNLIRIIGVRYFANKNLWIKSMKTPYPNDLSINLPQKSSETVAGIKNIPANNNSEKKTDIITTNNAKINKEPEQVLYKESDKPILKTDIMRRYAFKQRPGVLKLNQYILSFESPEDNIFNFQSPVASIKKIEYDPDINENSFTIYFKEFLSLERFYSEYAHLWVKTINRVMAGDFRLVDENEYNEVENKIKEKKAIDNQIRTYILENWAGFCDKIKISIYYSEQTGKSLRESKQFTEDTFAAVNEKRNQAIKEYAAKSCPELSRINEGYFENDTIMMLLGSGNPEYLILTNKELIEYSVQEKCCKRRFDIFKISRLELGMFGLDVNFKYNIIIPMSVKAYEQGNELIQKIKNLQKGIY